MHTHKILILTKDYPVRAYAARVKAIGSIHLSVCLSVQKSPDLEIQASEQQLHNESIKIASDTLNRLVRSMNIAKLCLYWPCISTAPPGVFCSCAQTSM